MVKPQQSELRRRDLDAPSDNRPGHHPSHEQDKPVGRDFVAKMHALAQADEAEAAGDEVGPPQTRADEVLDLTDVPEDTVHTGSAPSAVNGPARGEWLAQLAGKPFAAAGAILSAVRRRLPDNH